MTPTRTVPTDTEDRLRAAVAAACAELSRGNPIGIPTETVYGLAGDATDAEAVVRIFEIKERPFFDPLIVHVPDDEWVGRLTRCDAETRRVFEELAETYWPGPLTVVLPRNPDLVPDLVTSGQPTVALRMSAHPVMQAVLEAFGKPLAAPSANRFGRISPTTAAHVQAELGGRIGLILDGGPTAHGVESTILALQGRSARILREGPIAREDLTPLVDLSAPDPAGSPAVIGAGDPAAAPGMLESHYAPRTPLQLITLVEEVPFEERRGAGLLAWGPTGGAGADFGRVENLSSSRDLHEAARNLFAAMRRLDDDPVVRRIFAQQVPARGIGHAIRDRLQRASQR